MQVLHFKTRHVPNTSLGMWWSHVWWRGPTRPQNPAPASMLKKKCLDYCLQIHALLASYILVITNGNQPAGRWYNPLLLQALSRKVGDRNSLSALWIKGPIKRDLHCENYGGRCCWRPSHHASCHWPKCSLRQWPWTSQNWSADLFQVSQSVT